MARDDEIERYIVNFPHSLAVDFKHMLQQLRNGNMSETEVKKHMEEKVSMACKMVTQSNVNEVKKANKKIHSKLICGND